MQGFEVHGIDASPKALEIARDWLKKESLRAELKNLRMEQEFPFIDNFFDAIISIQVIHHNVMRDIAFTIKEITRVLKLGGYIFITVPIWEVRSRKKKWYLKENEDNTYIPRHGLEKGILHHFFTLEEIYEVFNSFDLKELYIDGSNHRAILGQKR